MIILIIGESGAGKTRACKNLGTDAVIMQGIRKRLPFSEKNSTVFFVESLEKLAASINRALASNDKNIFVIDDFQNLILKKLIFGSKKDKFQCYIDVAEDVQTLLDAAENSDKRFYFLMHEEMGENQKIAALTAGKLLKEKFKFEGFFTVVLRAAKEEAGYLFYSDDAVSVAKAPEGIFEKRFMENDIAQVDAAICDFYGIKKNDVNVAQKKLISTQAVASADDSKNNLADYSGGIFAQEDHCMGKGMAWSNGNY